MPTTIDGTTGVSLIQTTAAPFLVGQVCLFAMNSAPSGFLKCNGAAVSRTTYAALFAAIGTTYGAGNGTTTFNVPDLRGEFLRSLDDGRGVDSGRAIGTAQSGQNASHSHTASTSSGGSHSGHSGAVNGGGHAGSGWYQGGTQFSLAESHGGHTHPVTVNADGGTEARPRNVALLSCIFTGVA